MSKEEGRKKQIINLSFSLESNASLWNIVFKGFDEEVVLLSRFEAEEPQAVDILKRFGAMVVERYRDCTVESLDSGIVIKKRLPTNDLSIIRSWTELMHGIQEEMLNLAKGVIK